jgi:hypothetical protein
LHHRAEASATLVAAIFVLGMAQSSILKIPHQLRFIEEGSLRDRAAEWYAFLRRPRRSLYALDKLYFLNGVGLRIEDKFDLVSGLQPDA